VPISFFKGIDFKSSLPSVKGFSHIGSTVFGLLAICAVFGVLLTGSYRSAEQLSIQASTNVAALIEQDIARNIELYNLSLQAVIEGMNDPKVMKQDADVQHLILFDRSATAEGLGSILVLDEHGDVLLQSQSTKPMKLNFSDRDYFKAHQDSADIGLFISRPFQSRLRGGDWSIGISRRLAYNDGRFAGIVLGTIRLEYFQAVFRKLDLGKNGSVSLMTEKGIFISRFPFQQSFVGLDARATTSFFNVYERRHVGFYRVRAFDGIDRLYSYRKIAGLPLILNVGISSEEIFSDWWWNAFSTSITLLALCVLVLVLTVRVGRELRKRRETEGLLAALATTDPLTGLANRRKFNDELTTEWDRATRAQTDVSLLMIDVDHFKRFNDTFGHRTGDEALQAVSACLKSAARRSGDLAVRYGGEEFTVLLPTTSLVDAERIAESIRTSVENIRVSVVDDVPCTVTVSIGIVSTKPSVTCRSVDLVEEADNALYAAKRAGRNRICAKAVRQVLPS
jgi:diguanylate cyclase (GGDEF)-like protein